MIFVESWAASYGSPYLARPDEATEGRGELIEDGPALYAHTPADSEPPPLAFVDGVRRVEASLYTQDPHGGAMARGVAGSHACGAVLVDPGKPPRFSGERVRRIVIWGSGADGALPDVAGGWTWHVGSIASALPEAPMNELQLRMRQAEGRLAEELAAATYVAVLDGPLTLVRGRDLPVVGFVKTHHRTLLPPAAHARVSGLRAGQRTSLFAHAGRYSAYLRLTEPTASASPWAGIVRIELPESAGLAASVATADRLAAHLPRFAGVAHRDPRAPQNLQPVGALESRLRHLLGDTGMAERAVRTAVAALAVPTPLVPRQRPQPGTVTAL